MGRCDAVCTAAPALALLAHLVGVSRESNMPIVCLALPPALAFGWVLHRCHRELAQERLAGTYARSR